MYFLVLLSRLEKATPGIGQLIGTESATRGWNYTAMHLVVTTKYDLFGVEWNSFASTNRAKYSVL